MKHTLNVLLASALSLVLSATAADWIHLTPGDGVTPKDKKIVIVTGDDEYKSETSMPMMAHILAERHGFDCKVLFAINRESGVIDTNQRDNIPGLEALADADLMVVYTRFRTLEDAQMKMIEDYLASGRPVIGIRTATHAFDFSKKPDSPFAKYSYNHQGEEYPGGFGKQVLGETWIRHWGHHGRQSSRGRFAPGQEGHPILRGIADGEIWGPTDVYEATLPLPDGCQAVLLGEVCENMNPDAGPAPAPPADAKGGQAINKNDPMMPIAWTNRRDVGAKGRVFTSTIGGAMSGKDDWASEGMRRMFVNACFWTLELEDQIPAKADVTPVLQPNPFRRGVKPEEALQQGLAELNAKQGTILFYGNSMVERLLEHGELEARLQIALPDEKLKVRSLAWTGDEVGNRLRLEGYAKHMKNLLNAWPANTIVLGYGLNEAFAGEAGLDEFRQHYQAHLRQLSGVHPGTRFVLLSPIASDNAATGPYAKAIAELAAEHNAVFVDLHGLTSSEHTSNGIHLNDNGNAIVGKAIANALLDLRGAKTSKPEPAHLREVAKAASAKHFRVAELVRPKNAVVYFGVRARPYEYNGEMPRYHEMIRLTDDVLHTLAADPNRRFASMPKPSLPPMGKGRGNDDGARTGIIKSVAEQQAEFKITDGYAVNVFASEETFPELRNPVQIAFDARGRLWVVTMPSFPHTVPGLEPPDKLLIFEDTDRDGVADKMTPFAEGFDALDGVAFHRDGVIVSEQPKLWLMRDTDGDDRADTKTELLRGIDVTDSHHGGMIATDPMGDIIFSDGVFHRSQLETPFGVHRGIDATTYRLDPATGRINTEWQHTTPNPWNVTFNRWGNIFQMYGDGDVYDGTSLIWTPIGAYQPYAYGRMTSYGKGSGTAVISSPNFPDKYQQGIASASLLGRYAVNLTILTDEEGMMKQKSYEPILSSPNAAFRPADLEFGMDGALYVSDFCSPIIGHAQHPMRDPHWDHDYGRIWRVVHTEKPLATEWPVIEGTAPKALCELLTHPQDLVRHHARIELRKHEETVHAVLGRWLADFDESRPDYEQALLEMMFVAEGLGSSDYFGVCLDPLLASKDAKYRGAAVQCLRLQADRLDGVKERLARLVNDPHPRVQLEVIDAVAHLRPTHPGIEEVLANIDASNKHVARSLATLDYGIEPAKGRSVPVLDVDRASQLIHWHYLGKDGENAPRELQVGRSKPPASGLFRSFVVSDRAQPAIVAINHKNLEIRVNDAVVFSQNSFWSGDQQVNVELVPGLNVIEILIRSGRRSGSFPPVYLYDPVGQALAGTSYPSSPERFRSAAADYKKMVEERGNVLKVQAVAGLKFAPERLRVTPGSKVRLVFDNPDVLIHNWVLLKPGSFEEVGALADQLAAQADGMAKAYLPDTDKILVASKLVGPKEQEELVFTAPSEPGEYPYVCTFPGHWRIMKGTLVVAEPAPAETVAAIPSTKASTKAAPKAITKKIGEGVVFETASSPKAFETLVPPKKPAGKIAVNRATNNDPVATLTDGKLAKGFGPVYANGIKNGAYRMDLGSVKPVTEITSWAYAQGGKRGAQRVTLYGSAHKSDPGWTLSDKSRYTQLGTIGTQGQRLQPFTALSLQAKPGKTLGEFRWIVWHVSPVTNLDENTAFQELAVVSGENKKSAAVVKPSAVAPKPVPAKPVPVKQAASGKPNIILVMTDDQGYGEVGFHGNPVLKTPNLDRFAAEGTELETFYVSPMCTPTRSSLMTGRYHYRTGAHDTYIGRSNMNPQETTIAEVFAGAGYRTGIFGKWHLGENYPMRAQDQGFQKVVVHGGGGIPQPADYPGNSYWDPTLLFDDGFKKTKGYCTDVFIDESIQFIEKSGDQPFFCYIPLNIPHAPFDVAEEFYKPYESQIKETGRQWTAKIYGMITQFDGAFQRLLDAVETKGLRDNTIIIFMTDNGPNSIYYTAGLRERKGSVHENGIRSPFVVQWPAGMKGGRKFKDPAMHIDLLPTLADACDIELPADLKLDGQSILGLWKGEVDKLPERTLFMQHNRGNLPTKFKNGMARKGRWKMVNKSGRENDFALFNMDEDPGENTNLATKHPDKVKSLVQAYEAWFDDVTEELRSVEGMPHPIVLDPVQKQDFRFTWQDWWGEKTGWRHTNYGAWRMSNPGKIDRFDVAIGIPRPHRGKAAVLRFIWQGKTVEKEIKSLSSSHVLENITLAKGTGFIEAQLHIDGKMWAVQEVRIKAHTPAAKSTEATGILRIDTQEDWTKHIARKNGIEISGGLVTPTTTNATLRSKLHRFGEKRTPQQLTITQSPVWHNWNPIPNLGPSNLGDAPVMLRRGEDEYWMFGRYGGGKALAGFKAEPATLEGFDIPLLTTPFPKQFRAPGGLVKGHNGYHAWQSKDMVHWVHHGAVTEGFSAWVTTAEYADGKLYIYYDYPNDQDPHLYIDDNLTDGLPGKNMGMAFADPSHGSDCAFIRDLDGKFHVIYEDWSPINASKHSWDSPLAGHAVSNDGIDGFKILPPVVDERTKPTGRFAEYPHPHWHATDPKKFPAKKGQARAFGKYEIHEPVQNAYGDWASICIGGRYYLFADYHPAKDKIRVGWFTSPSLDQQFTFCGEIGRGHPDPDIMFAEGKFYLATQMKTDYVSPGPWVETVTARVGVDTDNDGSVDQWTGWQEMKESYKGIDGFSKQVAKTPAALDLSGLPAGFGFQFEIQLEDTTRNQSAPILDSLELSFRPPEKEAEPKEGAGWTDLLAGDSLALWEPGPSRAKTKSSDIGDRWSVKDGTVHLDRDAKEGRGGQIWTKKSYKDFDLTFEFNIAHNGNSGIKYRSVDVAGRAIGCEYQIIDDDNYRDNKNPTHRTACLYELVAVPKDRAWNPAGEWNTGRIRVLGNTFEHWLNGVKVVSIEFDSENWKERFAQSKYKVHPNFAKEPGPIVLTDHGDTVSYRKLRILEIQSESP